MNETGNETLTEYMTPYYFDPLNLMLRVVGTVSSVVGLIGNATVLTLIFGSNKFRRPANMVVANLSFTSIVYILVTNLRFYAGRLKDPLNEYLFVCLLSAFLGKFTHALIAFTSMAIVIDRNYRVKHPMSTTSKKFLFKIIIFIWLSALIVTFPRVYMYNIQSSVKGGDLGEIQRKCVKIILWKSPSVQVMYLVLYFAVVTVLPISTAILGLIQISKFINILSTCQQSEAASSLRYRILRNTFVFSVVFILGWGPSGVIMCLTEFPPGLMPHFIGHNFSFFKYFNIVGFVQNSLNPILLFVLSSDLRQYIYHTKNRLCQHS